METEYTVRLNTKFGYFELGTTVNESAKKVLEDIFWYVGDEWYVRDPHCQRDCHDKTYVMLLWKRVNKKGTEVEYIKTYSCKAFKRLDEIRCQNEVDLLNTLSGKKYVYMVFQPSDEEKGAYIPTDYELYKEKTYELERKYGALREFVPIWIHNDDDESRYFDWTIDNFAELNGCDEGGG